MLGFIDNVLKGDGNFFQSKKNVFLYTTYTHHT
jgi:hypothetical protein